jgi:hypothetical protein
MRLEIDTLPPIAVADLVFDVCGAAPQGSAASTKAKVYLRFVEQHVKVELRL